MRFQRYHCARAGVFLLAGFVIVAAPVAVQARSSFNNGLTSTIDQVVNLIAEGSQGNQPRWEIRQLRSALEQLLDVLEGHHHGHHHGMGKGMKFAHHHHHHHHKIGAAAGNKDNSGSPAPVAKGQGGNKGIGAAPGKNAAANRKPGSQTQSWNSKTNNGVGARLGSNKNQQNVCKNAAFGNAKSGNPQFGKAGVAVGANASMTSVRGIGAGKTAASTPASTTVKGNAAVNPRNTVPVSARKSNGSINPMGMLAMQQNRAKPATFTFNRQAAGSSVGQRGAIHANPIRRR